MMRRYLYPGRTGYPAIIDWELISRLVRFVRAGNRCEWCGVANGQQVVSKSTGRVYRIVLTVAHLDQDPSNSLNADNLVALCQPAHLRLDAGMKSARRRTEAGQGTLVDVPHTAANVKAHAHGRSSN